MRQVTAIVIAFIVAISLFGCEGDTSTNSNGGPASQLMHVYADRCQYWNEAGDSLITAAIVGGRVLGDPVPCFDYVKVNDRVFAGNDYCTYYEGYCSFGSFGWGDYGVSVTSNLEVLDITVKTSCSLLNGTIDYPDPITSLTLSEYDMLQLGQPLTVSWSGSEADFYALAVGYNWQDYEGSAYYSLIDTFAVGNSVTFPGSIFVHHGEIYWIQVQAINGPFPGPGAVGNMIGNGSGFLYYYGQGIYNSFWIIVGSSSSSSLMETSPDRPSEREIRAAIRRKIENLITGHY